MLAPQSLRVWKVILRTFRLKSFSGIKSLKSLQEYMGVSEEEQDKAMEFMDKKNEIEDF